MPLDAQVRRGGASRAPGRDDILRPHRQAACLFACLLLCADCGKRPAAPARTRPPAYVKETATPVPGRPWTVPDLGLELVFVEAGSFMMGSEDGGGDEKPVHEVHITRPFWMGKYEVTQAEYEALLGSNPSHFRKGRVLREEERDWWLWRKLAGPREVVLTEDTSEFPVEQVSWEEAVALCVKLSDRERRAGRLPDGYEFRLPTEAEWEYTARGGAGGRTTKYAGGDVLGTVAWYDGNSEGRPHAVGGKKANELGLHDMTGNVWEWCLDWYGPYEARTSADPSGPATGPYRVYRGGGWSFGASFCRVARRLRDAPADSCDYLGFRVVLAPPVH